MWTRGRTGLEVDVRTTTLNKADFRSQGYRGIWSIHLSGPSRKEFHVGFSAKFVSLSKSGFEFEELVDETLIEVVG